jgi:hypothetical protein
MVVTGTETPSRVDGQRRSVLMTRVMSLQGQPGSILRKGINPTYP